MNQILLSFLCGCAFIGGAAMSVVMVSLFNTMKSKSDRAELVGYWKQANESQKVQVEILERIAACNERKELSK